MIQVLELAATATGIGLCQIGDMQLGADPGFRQP
jgi:hypothetical protein